MHESYSTVIAPTVADKWAEERENNLSAPKQPKAGFRAQVARDLFAALPLDEQAEIAARAKEEAATRKTVYQKAMKDPASTAPADRQKCIDALPEFMGPILRGVQEYTGLHAVLIFGGPMPKYNGELRTLHIAHGRNATGAGDTWPQWDRNRFTKHVVDFMTEYLGTAFTPQQSAAASLTPDAALAGAKYTIGPKKKGEDSDSSGSESSDVSEDDDDESDSNSGSGSSDDEDSRPSKKQKKKHPDAGGKGKERARSNTPRSASSSPSPPTPPPNPYRDENGHSHEDRRALAAGRNKALADELKASFVLKHPERVKSVKPAAEKRKRAPRGNKGAEGPVRKSARVAGVNANADAPSAAPAVPRPRPRPTYKGATSSAASGSGGTENMPPDDIPEPPLIDSTPAGTTTTPLVTAPTAPSSPTSIIPPSTPHTTITSPSPSGTNADAAAMATPRASAYATPPPTARQPLLAGPAPPGCPPDAPAWFSGAYAQMTATALGPHFNAVLVAWIRIEAASRYEHANTKLPSKHRPKQVGTWIARGRTKAAETTVRDPRAYAAQWQLWWDELQPVWRTRDEDGVWSVTGGYGESGKEWGALFQWGVNGVLSVVASLYFWGIACADEDSQSLWDSATSDVGWMFEGLAVYYEKWKRKF